MSTDTLSLICLKHPETKSKTGKPKLDEEANKDLIPLDKAGRRQLASHIHNMTLREVEKELNLDLPTLPQVAKGTTKGLFHTWLPQGQPVSGKIMKHS